MTEAAEAAKSKGERPRFARTALLLLPVQIVFRAGEAILPLLLAAWFGRTPETDVYYLASAYFVFVATMLAFAFQDSALVPTLIEVEAQDAKALPIVAGALLGHAIAFGVSVATVTGGVGLAYAALHYTGGLQGTALALVVAFVPYVIVMGVRAFFVGLLNAKNWYFAHPVASGTGIAVAIGLAWLLKRRLGIVSLPVAFVAGELVALGILLFIALALAKLRLKVSLARPEPVRRFVRIAVNDVGGAAITRVNPIVDQLVAALSGVVGGGTLLRYAMDVSSLPASLLQATILPVLLSSLSHDAAARSMAGVSRTVNRSLLAGCAALLGLSVVVGLVRRPLLHLLFLHGAMDVGGVDDIADILPYALLGAAPFGALLILARANVVLQNLKILIPLGVLNAVLNAVFDVVFFHFIGLRGIALSTTMMHLAIAIVFWFAYRRKLAAET